mmetsp:Transcript_8250/g.19052  ORF Transcript_8250/g.19052 Transcript_8250/m.19052 type:complete len:422 (-) Transcript_8250:10-1275(-)
MPTTACRPLMVSAASGASAALSSTRFTSPSHDEASAWIRPIQVDLASASRRNALKASNCGLHAASVRLAASLSRNVWTSAALAATADFSSAGRLLHLVPLLLAAECASIIRRAAGCSRTARSMCASRSLASPENSCKAAWRRAMIPEYLPSSSPLSSSPMRWSFIQDMVALLRAAPERRPLAKSRIWVPIVSSCACSAFPSLCFHKLDSICARTSAIFAFASSCCFASRETKAGASRLKSFGPSRYLLHSFVTWVAPHINLASFASRAPSPVVKWRKTCVLPANHSGYLGLLMFFSYEQQRIASLGPHALSNSKMKAGWGSNTSQRFSRTGEPSLLKKNIVDSATKIVMGIQLLWGHSFHHFLPLISVDIQKPGVAGCWACVNSILEKSRFPSNRANRPLRAISCGPGTDPPPVLPPQPIL